MNKEPFFDCRDIEDNQDFYDDIASFEKNGNNCSLFIDALLLLLLTLLFLWHILSNEVMTSKIIVLILR